MSSTSEWFPSKRDGWLVALIWGASLAGFAACVAAAFATRAQGASASIGLGLTTLSLGFGPWILHGTGYALGEQELRIHAGPFRWRVPLAEIESIEPSRNPLSSPACSLDRLLIVYGSRKIMISPEGRARFMGLVSARCPKLRLDGERLHRAS